MKLFNFRKKNLNVFKVQFPFDDKVETYTYNELNARIMCMSDDEKKILNDKVVNCTSLTDIPDGLFDNVCENTYQDVFKNCETLNDINNL